MIDRYARPRMKRVWSDQSKYDKWLLIELAVCEAWSEARVIPAEDMEKLSAARYDIDRLNEVLRITKHDMTAFLRSVTEQLGPEGRWLHLGLTTSDVWDTATSLQMVDAADILIEEVSGCIRCPSGPSQPVQKDTSDDGAHSWRPRGADHVRTQARTMVGRDAPEQDAAKPRQR